jgi:hypothetical protein
VKEQMAQLERNDKTINLSNFNGWHVLRLQRVHRHHQQRQKSEQIN